MNYQSLVVRNKLILFLSFFFLLRIAYSYFFGWQEIPYGSDGISYNNYALAILNQSDWLANPDFLGNYRPPAYPIFLAIIYSIFGVENFYAVYCIQAFLNTLTIYYIFKLSTSFFDEKKSYLSLVWAGLYFFYIWYGGMILRETLVQFLIIFSFYHLWGFFKKGQQTHYLKNTDLWKFMIAFMILVHTDPKYLFYIPFVSILFVFCKNFGVGIKQYSWVLMILILLLVPWTIRNYIAYDRLVIINTRTLDEYVLNVINRYIPGIISTGLNKKEVIYKRNYPSEEERALIKKGKNPHNRSSAEIAIIKKNVYPPSTKNEMRLYRIKEMWIPFRFWSDYDAAYNTAFRGPWSLKHNLTSIIFYGTLIPFFFYGLFHLFRARHKAVWFLISPIFIHTLLHNILMGHGRERHRIQIDAFIIILGCYGMIVVYDIIQKGINRRSI